MEEERIDDELLDLDDVLAPEEASSDTGQLYEHFRVEVDKGQEPERIDKYLSVRMQHSSRNRIQKAADAGSIHVNGTPVKSNYKVRPEDVITSRSTTRASWRRTFRLTSCMRTTS